MEYYNYIKGLFTKFTISSNTIDKARVFFNKRKKYELKFRSNQCAVCAWRSNLDMCKATYNNHICPIFNVNVCDKCGRNPCICNCNIKPKL